MSCPFMGKNSEIKNSDPDDFEIEVACPLRFFCQIPEKYIYNKLGEKASIIPLHNFPIYLRNTLFHPIQIKKLRTLEIIEKLIPFDDFKKEGNKLYHLEEYDKAIECYEHAYSIYKYLELLDSSNSTDVKIILTESVTTEEVSFRNMALITILSNLASAFMKLRSFDQAFAAVTEALEFKPKDPNLLIKKAKIRLSNLKDSKFEEAIKDIESACIFNSKFQFMIEKYHEIVNYRKKITNDLIVHISNSYLKDTCAYDFEINQEKELEHRILQMMEEKYYEIIQFYLENNKYANLAKIREEVKVLQIVLFKMEFIFYFNADNSTFTSLVEEKIGKDKKINLAVLDTVKRSYISIVFTEGKFNEQLLSFCMEKIRDESHAKIKTHESFWAFEKKYFVISAFILGVVIFWSCFS